MADTDEHKEYPAYLTLRPAIGYGAVDKLADDDECAVRCERRRSICRRPADGRQVKCADLSLNIANSSDYEAGDHHVNTMLGAGGIAFGDCALGLVALFAFAVTNKAHVRREVADKQCNGKCYHRKHCCRYPEAHCKRRRLNDRGYHLRQYHGCKARCRGNNAEHETFFLEKPVFCKKRYGIHAAEAAACADNDHCYQCAGHAAAECKHRIACRTHCHAERKANAKADLFVVQSAQIHRNNTYRCTHGYKRRHFSLAYAPLLNNVSRGRRKRRCRRADRKEHYEEADSCNPPAVIDFFLLLH